MLSAVISSERSQPAVLLAEQLAHQRFVRPGPLVLGTALLKSPAPAEDRDRTVSRMFIPHYWRHRLYLHPLSRGRRVMGSIDLPCGSESHLFTKEEVVTGTHAFHAAFWFRNLHGLPSVLPTSQFGCDGVSPI